MPENTNEILNTIGQQEITGEALNGFVYALFIVVGISMVFEYFVRNYKTEIRKRKEEEKDYKYVRRRLWLVYGIHFVFMVILGLITKFAMQLTDIYVIFLLIVTFYVVEFAPLFNFTFWKKKKEEK